MGGRIKTLALKKKMGKKLRQTQRPPAWARAKTDPNHN